MIPLQNARYLLSKAVRTDPNGCAKLAEQLKIASIGLEEFSQGEDPASIWKGKATDNLAKLADYYYQGTRRYDPEADTLLTVNTAMPTPLLIGMPASVVEGAIAENANRVGHNPETYKGLVDMGRKLEPKNARR